MPKHSYDDPDPGSPTLSGTIIKIVAEKGFGFITDGNTEYFFHRSATVPHMWETLTVGQHVTFQVTSSAKGPRATSISLG